MKTKEKCAICKEEVKGLGHNAEPVKTGRCCELCNDTYVIPARVRQQLFLSISKDRYSL